jgi:hypothetical protein
MKYPSFVDSKPEASGGKVGVEPFSIVSQSERLYRLLLHPYVRPFSIRPCIAIPAFAIYYAEKPEHHTNQCKQPGEWCPINKRKTWVYMTHLFYDYLPSSLLYFCPEKNHELLLFPDNASFCSPEIVGMVGSPPPPRRGFAILDPAPPNENPPVGDPRPRVEPLFAASRRSLTAVNWASNLRLVSRNQNPRKDNIPMIRCR